MTKHWGKANPLPPIAKSHLYMKMLLKSFIESWLKIIFLVLAASFQLASRHVEDII